MLFPASVFRVSDPGGFCYFKTGRVVKLAWLWLSSCTLAVKHVMLKDGQDWCGLPAPNKQEAFSHRIIILCFFFGINWRVQRQIVVF